MRDDILKKVGKLYTDSLKIHGINSKSVGWKDANGHILRFKKLCEVLIDDVSGFSINDLGCGFGSLFIYLKEINKVVTEYYGYDISQEMLSEACKIVKKKGIFYLKSKLETTADYSITSGIFNVKFDVGDEQWVNYIKETLHNLNDFSIKGFSFNMLSTYVDWKESHLFYGDPCFYFDYCKKNFSKKVSLLHDTDLYEWTIVVRK